MKMIIVYRWTLPVSLLHLLEKIVNCWWRRPRLNLLHYWIMQSIPYYSVLTIDLRPNVIYFPLIRKWVNFFSSEIVSRDDAFLRNLIKWLWEFYFNRAKARKNIFYLIPRRRNSQAYTKWKLVWKATSISEAWECEALKWHANQFDGIQIVFHLSQSSTVCAYLWDAGDWKCWTSSPCPSPRMSEKNSRTSSEERKKMLRWLIRCDNKINWPRF